MAERRHGLQWIQRTPDVSFPPLAVPGWPAPGCSLPAHSLRGTPHWGWAVFEVRWVIGGGKASSLLPGDKVRPCYQVLRSLSRCQRGPRDTSSLGSLLAPSASCGRQLPPGSPPAGAQRGQGEKCRAPAFVPVFISLSARTGARVLARVGGREGGRHGQGQFRRMWVMCAGIRHRIQSKHLEPLQQKLSHNYREGNQGKLIKSQNICVLLLQSRIYNNSIWANQVLPQDTHFNEQEARKCSSKENKIL